MLARTETRTPHSIITERPAADTVGYATVREPQLIAYLQYKYMAVTTIKTRNKNSPFMMNSMWPQMPGIWFASVIVCQTQNRVRTSLSDGTCKSQIIL